VVQSPRRRFTTAGLVRKERTKDVLMEMLKETGVTSTVLRITAPSLTVSVIHLLTMSLRCSQSVRLVSLRPVHMPQLKSVILVRKESMPDVLMEMPNNPGATKDVKPVKTTSYASKLTVNVDQESPPPQNVMRS